MSILNIAGTSIVNWAKARAEDFEFWYDKAKDEFSNGKYFAGIKNLGLGVADVITRGEISDTYEEAVKPAIEQDAQQEWTKNNITHADETTLKEVYSSMSDYASIMSDYTQAVINNDTDAINKAKENLNEYVSNIMSDDKDTTSVYALNNLTQGNIKGSADTSYSDDIKAFDNASEDNKADATNALSETILSNVDSMIEENGADAMHRFYELAENTYSNYDNTTDLSKYEQAVSELGILEENNQESQEDSPTSEK